MKKVIQQIETNKIPGIKRKIERIIVIISEIANPFVHNKVKKVISIFFFFEN